MMTLSKPAWKIALKPMQALLLAWVVAPAAFAVDLAAAPAAILAPASALVHFAAADQALSVLPPEIAVRKMLEALPQLRASSINVDQAKTGKTRLEAGHYEWTARAGIHRRMERNGPGFNEQEVTLERPVRWFGKAGQDAAIGEKGIFVAEAGRADVWHEAGRSLMTDWFGALREMAAVRSLTRQQEVALQLRAVAEKRVRAGDAAQLELLQADTESARVAALLLQAQQRQEQMLQWLGAQYPGLPQPASTALPEPATPAQSPAYWMDKIMGDNHELELAQADADLYALQASRVASDRMPDPSVGLRAGRERDGQERIFGLSLSIPLPGAVRSADSSAADLKAKLAQERLALVRIKVLSAAQRAVGDSRRSHQIWQTMQQIGLQSAQQATTMMSAYQLGEATLSEALSTRRLALDAALAQESAQIDALAANARLQLDAHLIWALD
jgi:cobalt-zinc-cadmium efflux system outer membrane protein